MKLDTAKVIALVAKQNELKEKKEALEKETTLLEKELDGLVPTGYNWYLSPGTYLASIREVETGVSVIEPHTFSDTNAGCLNGVFVRNGMLMASVSVTDAHGLYDYVVNTSFDNLERIGDVQWEDDETRLVTGTDGFVLVVGVEPIGWEVSIGHEFLSRTEPTVRDAQRRVLKVLAALLEPLGEE